MLCMLISLNIVFIVGVWVHVLRAGLWPGRYLLKRQSLWVIYYHDICITISLYYLLLIPSNEQCASDLQVLCCRNSDLFFQVMTASLALGP